MLKQSADFMAAFRSNERTLTAKVTVGSRSFTADDLVSIDYDSGAMTGDQMGIGSTYENSVKIAFANLVEGIKAQDKVSVAIGIQLPDKTFEYAPLGIFYVDGEITMDRNNKLTTISAVDGMCWLEGIYTPKVTAPTTLSVMALDIANQAGTDINQGNFDALPNIPIEVVPTGQTYRGVLGLLAMLIPGYVTFDRNGLLCLRGITQEQYSVPPDDYEFQGLTKNENPYTVSGITVTPLTEPTYSATNETDTAGTSDTTTKSLHVGTTTGSQLTLQNDFMTNRILTDIWGVLEEIQYYPYTLNWFGNPAVEAGDWLTIEDTSGSKFVVPNSSYTLSFAGGLNAVSKTAETVTSPTTWNARETLSQTVKTVVRQMNATGTYTFYTPTQPVNASESDLWYKPSGSTTELLIYSGGQWIPIVSDMTGYEISQKIMAAQADIHDARKVADAASALAGTKVSSADYASKITQLANDINLRVTKGDVISQLNMEAGQTLIQSGKILLDAPSVVFAGNAFIPDAAIQNLSASKLTTGTLDANVINVINMNASNISAGILSGKNISMNLETGAVEFQYGNIHNGTNTFNIDIDEGSIESKSNDNKVLKLTDAGIEYYQNKDSDELSGIINFGWTNSLSGKSTLDMQSSQSVAMTYSNPVGASNPSESTSVYVGVTGVTLTNGTPFVNGEFTDYSNLQLGDGGLNCHLYSRGTGTFDSAIANLSIYDSDGNLALQVMAQGKDIFGNPSFEVGGNTSITGTLNVAGSKNAVHVTRDGVRATPAYETAESYLGDIGESITDDTGQVVVPIETLFGDTVNTTIPYQVFIESYSSAHVWVAQRCGAYFVVQSDKPNAPFTWEIKAKRRGYENNRLVKADVSVKEIAKQEGYQE